MINDISEEYFDWLCGLIYDHKPKRKHFRKLLLHLHRIEFRYSLPMDANRKIDGINLRYTFGRIYGYRDGIINEYLDDQECSILEMLIALVHRCESTIMTDSDIGNRTGFWFWNIMDNLGLISMDDKNYDSDYIDHVLEILLNREFKPNGEGGLVTLYTRTEDLRTVEIWYQMMWYLSENYSDY